VRALLYRLAPGESVASAELEKLVGKPVHEAPGSARVVGRVKRVELINGDVFGDLELDAAFLPHELALPPVSIARVTQAAEPRGLASN
jgi:hypothetical protein